MFGYQQSWLLRGALKLEDVHSSNKQRGKSQSSGEVFKWHLPGQWKAQLKACRDTIMLLWSHVIVVNVTLFLEQAVSLGESGQISLIKSSWSDAEMLLDWKWSVLLLPWQRRPSSASRWIISFWPSFKLLNSLQADGLITDEGRICISGLAGSS